MRDLKEFKIENCISHTSQYRICFMIGGEKESCLMIGGEKESKIGGEEESKRLGWVVEREQRSNEIRD